MSARHALRRRLLGAALAALLGGSVLATPAGLRVIELAIETGADATVLPSGPLSSLVVTPCGGCPPLSLPTTAQSRYFIGEQEVSLEDLKRRVAGQPTTMLVILYRKDSRELTRVIASAR